MTARTVTHSSTNRNGENAGSVTYDEAHEGKVIGVASRTKVAFTGSFSIKVPKKTNTGVNPENGETYTHFYHLVTGGGINFHIYGKPERRGNKIRVTAEIWMKEMNDGTKYMYVDLFPVEAERLDCEMKSFQDIANMPDFPSNVDTFECMDGGKGALAFIPIDHEKRQREHEERMKRGS